MIFLEIQETLHLLFLVKDVIIISFGLVIFCLAPALFALEKQKEKKEEERRRETNRKFYFNKRKC